MIQKKNLMLIFMILLFLFFIIKFWPESTISTSAATPAASSKNQSADTSDLSPEKSGKSTANAKKKSASQPVFKDGEYTLSIPSSIGTLTYYNQTDVRWADAIYGGDDPISTHGCGPTVLAMLVSSFTNQVVPPDAMAAWAKDNHYWANNSGSLHALIPEGAAFYGFSAESFTDYTAEGILDTLKDNSVLVALMGPGHFTDNGHFIIIADDWSGTCVRIADSNSLENTQKPWDVSVILDELNYGAQAGGPLWRISIK